MSETRGIHLLRLFLFVATETVDKRKREVTCIHIVFVDKILPFVVHHHFTKSGVEDIIIETAQRTLAAGEVPLCPGRQAPHSLYRECTLRDWRLHPTIEFKDKVFVHNKAIVERCTGSEFPILEANVKEIVATQAAAAGVSVQTIQDMYNHGSIQTTMRYVKALDTEKHKAINIMDNIF